MSRSTEQHHDASLGKFVQEFEIGKLSPASQVRIALYLAIAIAFVFWLFTLPTAANEDLVWWQRPLENPRFFITTILPLLAFGIFLIPVRRKKTHKQVLFYERGLKNIEGDKITSAPYQDLKISQIISGGKFRLYTYTLWFPNGYSFMTTDQKVAKTALQAIAQAQLPIVLQAYQRGADVDFGSVHISRQGMAVKADRPFSQATSHSNAKLIPWSDVKYVKTNFRLGKLFVHRTKDRAVPISFGSGKTYNLSVLLGLLKHLGYLPEPRQSVDI
ncbi:MAG: DUF6585 family protein [Leptolyngbyaceae cyanobacterium]